MVHRIECQGKSLRYHVISPSLGPSARGTNCYSEVTAMPRTLSQTLPLCYAVRLEISTISVIRLSYLQPESLKRKHITWEEVNPLAVTNVLAQVRVSQKLGLEGRGLGCPGQEDLEWKTSDEGGREGQEPRPELAVLRTLGDSWDKVLVMGKRRMYGNRLTYFYNFAQSQPCV